MRLLLTFLLLFAVWFAWSGHTEPLMLGFGVVSCTAVVALAHRMRIIDDEALPFAMLPRILAYVPWLLWQVVLSNLAIARVLLSRRMPINPQLVRVKSSQRTVLGRVILANTITITPGTVTIDVRDDYLLVHALTDAAAKDEATGVVDRRVSRLEGRRP